MPIRVAFNATPLLSTMTGIGNYIVELGAALAKRPDVDAHSFYRFRWRHEFPQPPARSGSGGRTIADRVKPWVPFRGALRQAAQHLGFARGLRRHGVQVYHEQNYVPLSYDVPVVITIHDLSWLRHPEAHPADRVRWLEEGLPKAIDRASAILVDSNFVRDEVLGTFGVDPARVHTATLGVPRSLGPMSPEETWEVLAPLGLRHGEYVLTVGTIEPRKNILHLVDAYERLPVPLRARFPLVVVGAAGWHSQEIVRRLLRPGDSQVRFLGQVGETALAQLYAGAGLFVFPSLYEGFGLPPLEAMACGVPVLVSDRASLPEVVGNAGETLDPDDPVQTAGKIQALLEDPVRRSAMASRSIARAAVFSWDGCADVAHRIYLAAASAESARSRQVAGAR